MKNISQHRSVIKDITDKMPDMRKKLFPYGFLLTNAEIDEGGYPFYNEWSSQGLGEYRLWTSGLANCKVFSTKNANIVMVGYMYNPFTMQYDENEILPELLNLHITNKDAFCEKLNQISGIFSLLILYDDEVYLFGDASCIQTNFYSVIGGKLYISTHQNLIGDICDLKDDEYVASLINYKYFNLFGNCLPSDLSVFSEVKRLVPNHFLSYNKKGIKVERFFTIKKLCKTESQIVDESAQILADSMKLISQKWENSAISMTGGCDSKTTMAATNGIYDKFKYFSYISSESEEVDARAAHEISKSLNIEHKIYEVKEENDLYENYESYRELLSWNGGGIVYNKNSGVRKHCHLEKYKDFDYEIKSWCSEIGRAYYSKRFNNRKSFGKRPTPRKCTTLYKVFLGNRKLVKNTDKAFKDYIERYVDNDTTLPWQEKFFWEYRISAWNGVVITGEQRFSFDIVIPYNNRILLNLLISAPMESKIKDTVYEKIREKLNPLVDKAGISVVNLKHTKNRARFENIYYMIHSKIPF